jgi:2-keto-4-pentenoate hydratase/2-oxohepta-3-ene-1,7-dioic acid hydratase in catechol pathway
MKLVRFGPPGSERPGLVDVDGLVRDLSGEIDDIGPEELAPKTLRRLAALEAAALPAAPAPVRFGVPVARVGKFIGIGYNYADHAAETATPLPTEPLFFTKAVTCLNGANDDVILPKGASKGDWEVELGVVIGTRASNVAEDEALGHVAGYCVVNDVSERAFQFDRGGTWDKGKGCDTFGPVGPWLVTPDEIADPQDLAMWLEINGVRHQSANTAQMIFPVAKLVSYVSEFMSLMPGDIISTGTPAGIGFRLDPPRFLADGDVMALGIDGLGTQCQRVRAHPGDAR